MQFIFVAATLTCYLLKIPILGKQNQYFKNIELVLIPFHRHMGSFCLAIRLKLYGNKQGF